MLNVGDEELGGAACVGDVLALLASVAVDVDVDTGAGARAGLVTLLADAVEASRCLSSCHTTRMA